VARAVFSGLRASTYLGVGRGGTLAKCYLAWYKLKLTKVVQVKSLRLCHHSKQTRQKILEHFGYQLVRWG
jgi:hypothetical protein